VTRRNAVTLRLAVFGFYATAMFHGQAYRALLLPEARQITGLVVEQSGKPIPEVHLVDLETWQQQVLTAADGSFDLRTSAPAVVLRKAGYRSYFLRTASSPQQVRIVLEPAEPPGVLKECSARPACTSIAGWSALFCLPTSKGVKANPQGQDIDYGIRTYVVRNPAGRVVLAHGAGPVGACQLQYLRPGSYY